MEYSLAKEMFAAEGIPITPTDDLLATNPYPLMRISAVDAQSDAALGHLDVVVPVATETDCRNCHQTGAMAAEGMGWSDASGCGDSDQDQHSKTPRHGKRDRPGNIPARVVCPVPLFTGAGSGRDRAGRGTGGQTQFFPCDACIPRRTRGRRPARVSAGCTRGRHLLPVSPGRGNPVPAGSHENGRHGLQRLSRRHAGGRREI
jgi:hypothetical protein